MKRILNPVIYVLAAAWFLVDAVFMNLAKPVADWLANHWMMTRVRTWIESLRPYPALALFAVPVILLEPVKPAAAYLAATGHFSAGAALFVIGELLKLVLVERLFSLTRDKLMTIPAFAWGFGKFCLIKEWLRANEAWRTVRLLGLSVMRAARRHVPSFQSSRTQRPISWQPR